MFSEIECILNFSTGALEEVRERRELINRLNVFPVPDGDTGTNMYLTLLFGVVEMKRDGTDLFSEAVRRFARGVVTGSRGNSGFILCQFINGLCEILSRGAFSSESLITGIRKGVDLAYSSLLEPREGTMLTVLRRMVEEIDQEKHLGLKEMIIKAHSAAVTALMETPKILEPLKRAGVVDAGGAGVVAALEGGAKSLGIPLKNINWETLYKRFDYKEIKVPKSGLRFMIDCSPSALRDLKKDIANLGDSMIIAGSSSPYRVHIHTDFPFDILRMSRIYGKVYNVATSELMPEEKMKADKLARSLRVRVLSICLGDGLGRVFDSMGIDVMRGGPGKQPSAGEIAEKLEEMDCDFVVVLPNDRDLIPTARTALTLTEKNAEVIPTQSPVQGLAACDEYIEDRKQDELVECMLQAVLKVVAARVTVAVRDADVGGVKVRKGQYIGMIEGDLAACGDKIVPVVLNVAEGLLKRKKGSILTVVTGADLTTRDANLIEIALKERFKDILLDWIDGGETGSTVIMGIE